MDPVNDKILALPLIPMRGVVAFPANTFTFDVGREYSIKAISDARKGDGRVLLFSQRDAGVDHPRQDDLHKTGVVAVIRHVLPMPDKVMRVLAEGRERVRLGCLADDGDMYTGYGEVLEDEACYATLLEDIATMHVIITLAKQISKMRGTNSSELINALSSENDIALFTYIAAANFISGNEDKLRVLETDDPHERLALTAELIGGEMSLVALEQKIQQRVQEAMERANREYYLREELNAIHEELGENEDEEIVEYRKKLAESKMSDEARDKTERELKRLAHAAPQSPEASVSQNYIEYMLELPWGRRDESKIDIARARRILEEDHYGLKDVKDRLIEYLAVRKSAENLRSPILCLVGPPGVGKTSIARSVARALGRKFTQVSLGGVHDEAEVRGHRKTYVGAMPGRIISSIHRCGTVNPVFLLDEIDKIAHDMRGDPAAALLEALDPEQNRSFKDHYIEAPFDLSDVLFITTANSTDPIDRALLDRMEVIEVPSYTQEEKRAIATKYLLPKQLAAHGLKKGSVRIGERTMDEIIEGYTREAGVRTLERTLEKLCRRAALRFIEDESCERISVRREDLKDFLGAKRYLRTAVGHASRVGVVNGLAWTSVGGEVMPVEAAFLPGKGNLELTGKLGDVMQESAKLALSIVRAQSGAFGIGEDFFEKHDLHIHVPEGATPKDGPSAGVALTCAVLSAATGRPARGTWAMTGEVTLHGGVLPIGGVREKLLAAYRMGITDILLPAENEKDLEEIDAKVLEKLNIRFLENVRGAIDTVLEGES